MSASVHRVGALTRTKARMVLAIPKISFPVGTSTAFKFKMAMRKSDSDTVISLGRVVVLMITLVGMGISLVCPDDYAGRGTSTRRV